MEVRIKKRTEKKFVLRIKMSEAEINSFFKIVHPTFPNDDELDKDVRRKICCVIQDYWDEEYWDEKNS